MCVCVCSEAVHVEMLETFFPHQYFFAVSYFITSHLFSCANNNELYTVMR